MEENEKNLVEKKPATRKKRSVETSVEVSEPIIIEKKKTNVGAVVLASIISLLLGSVGMYLLVYFVLPIDNSSTIINKSEKEVTITDQGIADSVEKLYDAVVVVEVLSNNKVYGTGTGFVYKTEGGKAYILTNDHVVSAVANANVKVIFTNGKEIDVTVEGSDKYSDLAVLSLDAKEVEYVAEIGDSEALRLGDTVFTVGAPLDTEYYWTVTRGIVSGKDRMVEVSTDNSNISDYVMRVLQTDASINSGNSGGPLANANGQVIGITNMKLVSNGVEGIGFAIPIEDAVDYADKIIKGESLKRPVLGLSMIDLTNTPALYGERLVVNTELNEGVVIAEVQDNSPAAKAKFKRGDIIVGIDDADIKNIAALRYTLYQHQVGDTIEVTYERNGKLAKTTVKLTVASE